MRLGVRTLPSIKLRARNKLFISEKERGIVEKLSFKEKAEIKFLEVASPVYNRAHLFGSLLRGNAKSAFGNFANYLHYNQHVPEMLNKVQVATASCVNCGSPICTAAFGAASIVPVIFWAKEKLELFGTTVAQHFRL